MEPIYMLWLREVKRYTRSKPQILASLGQPLLYLLALGFGLGATYQKANGGSYLQFISPGIIGMAVLFSSVFSGIALLWDRLEPSWLSKELCCELAAERNWLEPLL